MSAAPGTARGGDLAAPRADATLMVEGGSGEMRAITRADTYEIKAPPPPDPDAQHRMSIKAPQVVTTIEQLRNKGEGRRFEPDVTRNPYAPKTWVSYLAATRDDFSFAERRLIYERALQLLPRSYKLWRLYLDEVEEAVRDRWQTSGRAKVLVLLYERGSNCKARS